MSPAAKYTLGRLGLFVACAIPSFFLPPRGMDPLLKLMIALVVSAALSFFLLSGVRSEFSERIVQGRARRVAEKERLRAALAGDDDPPDSSD